MGNILNSLYSVGFEEKMEIEINLQGFICPYCMDKAPNQKGHVACIKMMGEEGNKEFDFFGFDYE